MSNSTKVSEMPGMHLGSELLSSGSCHPKTDIQTLMWTTLFTLEVSCLAYLPHPYSNTDKFQLTLFLEVFISQVFRIRGKVHSSVKRINEYNCQIFVAQQLNVVSMVDVRATENWSSTLS